MYKFIKEYFDLKLYTVEDVKVFVKANWITEEEFKQITGIKFVTQ